MKWKYGKLLAVIPMGFVIWALWNSKIQMLQIISGLTALYTLLLILSIPREEGLLDIFIGITEIAIMLLFTIFMKSDIWWAIGFSIVTLILIIIFIRTLSKIELVD